MRTYRCQCGNPLFFDNSLCLACHHEIGFCPACRQLTTLLPTEPKGFQCSHPECGATLVKCFNYAQYEVCNRCLVAEAEDDGCRLCGCCRFNQTIPDLDVPGNLQKWYRLEAAKRRLFYDLDQLGLPYGTAADGIEPCLAFAFKCDAASTARWHNINGTQQIYTGHSAGLITINLREVDDVEREKARVAMGESKRTLIGHFRHEIAHFYWDALVKGRREAEFIAAFGDHNQPPYAEALEAHYQNGPPRDWAEHYISAYASSHPWEDFAETFAAYLSMVGVLDTAHHMGMGGETDPIHADLASMVVRYQQLGIAMNEMNRSIGLLDVVPEVFVPPVVEKLAFVHELAQKGRQENGALQPPAEAASV